MRDDNSVQQQAEPLYCRPLCSTCGLHITAVRNHSTGNKQCYYMYMMRLSDNGYEQLIHVGTEVCR